MSLAAAAMYTSGPVSEDTVYVAEARRLPVQWKRTEHISLIIAGKIKDGYFEQSDVDYICVDDTRMAAVFNAVLSVFRNYSLFVDKIKNAVIEDSGTDATCEALSEFIGNPVVIFDQLLRVMHISSGAVDIFNWETDATSGMRLLPADFVNQMYLVRRNAESVGDGDCVLLGSDALQYNIICAKGNGSVYTMLVFEIERPLTQGVLQLTGQISGLILASLDGSLKSPGAGGMASFVIAMLDKTRFSKYEIGVTLEAAGWKESDNFCCIVLTADTSNKDDIYNSTFCLRLGNQFRSCVAFLYKENVVAVVNLDKSECTVRDIPNRIGVLLRDGLFHAGISFKYWDFVTTSAYYEQACSAYEIGKLYNPAAWCYSFVDYALRYFMHYGFSRIPAYHLCYPGLVQLYLYDRENNTELLPTLKTYVDCRCRAAPTAQKLYIHRNTFYQRMSKIHEILDLDLEDRDTRLYIQISNYIMEMYNYELSSGLL